MSDSFQIKPDSGIERLFAHSDELLRRSAEVIGRQDALLDEVRILLKDSERLREASSLLSQQLVRVKNRKPTH